LFDKNSLWDELAIPKKELYVKKKSWTKDSEKEFARGNPSVKGGKKDGRGRDPLKRRNPQAGLH